MDGFVYIWYDVKKAKFYIGSHWGSQSDGYVCSSQWMLRAYRRRPNDFKRRILSIHDDRCLLLSEELRVLNLIRDDELGKKYYNLAKHSGHWHASNLKSTREKLKASWTEERKQKARITQSKPWTDERLTKFRSKTIGRKRSSECIKKLKDKWSPERRTAQADRLRKVVQNRYKNFVYRPKRKILSPDDFSRIKSQSASKHWFNLKQDEKKFELLREKMSRSAIERERRPHTKESIAKMSALKIGKEQRIVICPHCNKTGGAATMPRWHFDNCKMKAILHEKTN